MKHYHLTINHSYKDRLEDITKLYMNNKENKENEKISIARLIRIAINETYKDKTSRAIQETLNNYSTDTKQEYNSIDTDFYLDLPNSTFDLLNDIRKKTHLTNRRKQKVKPTKRILIRIAINECYLSKNDDYIMQLLNKYRYIV